MTNDEMITAFKAQFDAEYWPAAMVAGILGVNKADLIDMARMDGFPDYLRTRGDADNTGRPSLDTFYTDNLDRVYSRTEVLAWCRQSKWFKKQAERLELGKNPLRDKKQIETALMLISTARCALENVLTKMPWGQFKAMQDVCHQIQDAEDKAQEIFKGVSA